MWPDFGDKGQGTISLDIEANQGTAGSVLYMLYPRFIVGFPPIQVLITKEACHVVFAPRKRTAIKSSHGELRDQFEIQHLYGHH